MLKNKPHLPEKDASLFIVDKTVENIKLDNIIYSYSQSEVLDGINTHPDMTFCPLSDKLAAVSYESFEYYNSILSVYGYNIIKGKAKLKKNYPYDIAYNCVIIGNKLFHKLDYTDPAILEYCIENGIEMINVKQGYTKCSTLIVDEKSIITCDAGLEKIYRANKIETLLVDNKEIGINNFDHGFIGGCGGKISSDKIGFFGNIETHPDFDKIYNFLRRRNISYINITDGPLFDYGSLIPIVT